MTNLADDSDVRVRLATSEDEKMLFEWRNRPELVAWSRSKRYVTPEEHHRWFDETITRRVRDLYIIEVSAAPAGMIRYDFHGAGEAEISIYLLSEYIGHGFGGPAFKATLLSARARGVQRIIARIIPENSRSLRFFRQLEFQQISRDENGHLMELKLGEGATAETGTAEPR